MCLYPKLIINKRYTATKKNKGIIPECTDERMKYVAVGCGKCIECRKQKARGWRIRMLEEIKKDKTGKFVTLTFSPEALAKLMEKYDLKECNAVAGKAIRLFLERWRKLNKRSVKHWLISEMGHKGTERIHLHGLIFTDKDKEYIQTRWEYGEIWVGDYVNEKTVNYIIKYCTKTDEEHKGFEGQIFSSRGIGADYEKNHDAKKKRDYYRLNNGTKVGLPPYYRNKIFTEDERETLWCELLDKGERYVMGEKITNIETKEGEQEYFKTLFYYRKLNKRLGYGDDSKVWKRKPYNVTLRMLNACKKNKRLKFEYKIFE